MIEIILKAALLSSSILSEAAVLQHVRDAGFPRKVEKTMVCIAVYESGLNYTATNTNSNGSIDYGLFQINGGWWGKHCPIDTLFDPIANTKCAKYIYDRQGLGAWVAYKKHWDICNDYLVKAAKCPTVVIVDSLHTPWRKIDEDAKRKATKTCREVYAPNTCLVEFRRIAAYTYQAICGRER